MFWWFVNMSSFELLSRWRWLIFFYWKWVLCVGFLLFCEYWFWCVWLVIVCIFLMMFDCVLKFSCLGFLWFLWNCYLSKSRAWEWWWVCLCLLLWVLFFFFVCLVVLLCVWLLFVVYDLFFWVFLLWCNICIEEIRVNVWG